MITREEKEVIDAAVAVNMPVEVDSQEACDYAIECFMAESYMTESQAADMVVFKCGDE
jgi:hypothetical protein